MNNDLDVDSPEVTRFLAELGALPETCDPTPSAELAALLESGLPGPVATVRSLRRPVATVSAVVLVAALSGTGWAAAATELPPPVQDALSRLSRHLPFDVPPSSERPGPDSERHGLPPDQPTRAHHPRPARAGDRNDRQDGAGAGVEPAEDIREVSSVTVPATGTPGGGGFEDDAEEDASEGDGIGGARGHQGSGTDADADDRADDDASEEAGDDGSGTDESEDGDEHEDGGVSGDDSRDAEPED